MAKWLVEISQTEYWRYFYESDAETLNEAIEEARGDKAVFIGKKCDGQEDEHVTLVVDREKED